jgi:hypothetical protein
MNREPIIAEAIGRAIDEHPNRRVPLNVLLTAAATVDHSAASLAGWRSRVLTAITELADDGRIELPRTKYDRAAHPPLPSWVSRPAALKSPRPTPQPPVWHAELAWAAQLFDNGTLTAAEQTTLIAINAWLPRRRGISVPMRERSLEIFGDEKLLEILVSGPLFTNGRLSPNLLEAFPCWPPVEQVNRGPGDWIFVENYTTYYSLGQRAQQVSEFTGRIIWGSGNQVGTRLSALVQSEPPPPRCFYFGDIDAGGFRIAATTTSKADSLGLPPMTPARGLYRLALQHGRARDDPRAAPNATSQMWAETWLGGQLGADAADVVRAGRRIVQECVGKEVLDATTPQDWY